VSQLDTEKSARKPLAREGASHKRVVKVLYVLGRMNRGGAELRTLELMRSMDRKRYRFEVCCLSGLPGDLDGEVRSLGGTVHLMPLNARFPSRFGSLLREGNFQTVHSYVHWFSGYILRLAAQAGVQQRVCHFASTEDGKGAHFARRIRKHILKRWVHAYATDIVGVCEGALTANIGPEWPRDVRCQVIYRGIEISRFQIPSDREGVRAEFCMPEDAVIVAHVGRMDPPKNHERLLFIFERFARMAPRAHLLLIGATHDPIESRIRGMVDRMALGKRVMFAGIRSDVPRLLRASDLMIFPSLWEGLPGAVLEAAAAELPVVASDLPGIKEIGRYFPAVHTIPLELSNEEWATVALEFQSNRVRTFPAEEPFLTGPFSMRYAVERCERLYSRQTAIFRDRLNGELSTYRDDAWQGIR
jgi:glycosyltransferase involved in cell wall biosynthesis